MQLHYINGEPTPETTQRINNNNAIRSLERELGLQVNGLYLLPWNDIKALYDGGKLTYQQLEIIYNRKKTYDTSIHNTHLDENGEMQDGRIMTKRERAKQIKEMLGR
ncbi:hypothetical protein P4V74_29710 [Bacillus thuringiensis]|nr:hypothetical protein [Bacillus thuringiensis]